MILRGGTYYSDFRLPNGERVRKPLGTSDKVEAQRLQRAMQVSMESKAALEATAPAPSSAPVGMTFKDAFKRARREYEPWRTSKSIKTIDDNYAHVTKHFGEHQDLARVDKKSVMKYTRELQDAGKAPSTINQRLSLISILLKCAEDWTDGVVSQMKMPRQKVRKGRVRTLSRAEESAVVTWFQNAQRPRARDADMADLVVFLVDTGFRLQEALNLRSQDVQWDNLMVPAWETKVDARLVPMTNRVQEILTRRSRLVSPFGMFSKDSADDHWATMRPGIGIDVEQDPEFVIHALRHTCASRLVAKGMDAFRVQKWMGHKSISTTQLYVTLFAPDLKDLAKALEEGHSESKGVSRVVPKGSNVEVSQQPRELPRRLALTGVRAKRPDSRTVGPGLLIRRSLVRAQVEEPDS